MAAMHIFHSMQALDYICQLHCRSTVNDSYKLEILLKIPLEKPIAIFQLSRSWLCKRERRIVNCKLQRLIDCSVATNRAPRAWLGTTTTISIVTSPVSCDSLPGTMTSDMRLHGRGRHTMPNN